MKFAIHFYILRKREREDFLYPMYLFPNLIKLTEYKQFIKFLVIAAVKPLFKRSRSSYETRRQNFRILHNVSCYTLDYLDDTRTICYSNSLFYAWRAYISGKCCSNGKLAVANVSCSYLSNVHQLNVMPAVAHERKLNLWSNAEPLFRVGKRWDYAMCNANFLGHKFSSSVERISISRTVMRKILLLRLSTRAQSTGGLEFRLYRVYAHAYTPVR